MSAGVIGVIIGIVVGFPLGGVLYFKGWDDCKEFIFTELDRRDNECIVYIVREMANELRGVEV